MSTNSTLNELTPSGRIEFVFKNEIIAHDMLIRRVGMEHHEYYVELDEEVPKDGHLLFEGQMEMVVTRVKITKLFFIELLLKYLPEDIRRK